MDPKGLTRTQYLRRVLRRWILFSVVMVVLYVVTTTLFAIWSPLAWAVPVAAAITLGVLIFRAIRRGYDSASS
jgi:uncharacterized membrane protein (DUF485 family)